MKCLYITSKPIYPIVDGGCFAMDSFIKLLSASGIEFEHIAIATQKHPFDQNTYPKGINVQSVHIDTTVKPLEALKYLIKKGAYNVERFHSDKVLETIQQTISRSSFDFIILDSLYSTTYLSSLKKIFKGKIYLRSHNCEAQIWYDLAENEKHLPKSIYYRKLAKDLEKYECEVLKNVDGILAISPEDLELFRSLHSSINACVIPVHVDVKKLENKLETNKIFHIGNMDWTPNVEAVDRLIGIFNRIRSKNNNLTLHIAGKHSDTTFDSQPAKGITVDGFVEDIQSYAEDHGILVSPIASSSGVRIKILEMMSLGVPIITTNAGARGLFPNGKSVIRIQDSDEEIGTSILELSSKPEELRKMSESAVAYIREYHSLEKISSDLKRFVNA